MDEEALGMKRKKPASETEEYEGRGSGHETEEAEESETEEAEARAAVRAVNRSRGRLALPGQRMPAKGEWDPEATPMTSGHRAVRKEVVRHHRVAPGR